MNDERQAIEALRAGVPNGAAIRLLGPADNSISEQFVNNLELCREQLRDQKQAGGQIIAGGFGAGKSHLLGCLQELAIARKFIVSWVVISKETPLFDLGKLYVSAIRNATVPDCNDDAMTALLTRLDVRSDVYDDLALWAESPASGLAPLFAALLHLWPRPNTDPERQRQIARFLAGSKPNYANFKQWLKEVGTTGRFVIKEVKQAELMRQRLRFIPRLIQAAGYSGWVLLLDEVELIGRYSVLQRGRSYAELARWLGLDPDEAIPGVLTVAAITDDFTAEVIDNRRDHEQVPDKLAKKNEAKNALRASRGIEALEKRPILLRRPSSGQLEKNLDRIRALYSAAYGWEVPTAAVGQVTAAKSMRQYIKSWITAWDLERLYGTRPEIETVEEVVPDYEENLEIEKAAPHNGISDDD